VTGHEAMEAFATLARVIEDRDRLADELAIVRRQATTEARLEYRKGYCARLRVPA
jgi:hypothetical protein